MTRARGTWQGVLLAVVVTIACTAGSALATAKITDYTAELVALDPTGKVESTMRLVVSGGKMRMEVPPQEGMESMVIIVRADKRLQWVVDDDSKVCIEQPMTAEQIHEMMPDGSAEPGDKVEVLGTEAVQGYKTIKKRVTTNYKSMGQVIQSVETIWQAQEFDLPLRHRDEEGFVDEMRNITPGRQAAVLFEVPLGYKMVRGKQGQMPIGMPVMPGEVQAAPPAGE